MPPRPGDRDRGFDPRRVRTAEGRVRALPLPEADPHLRHGDRGRRRGRGRGRRRDEQRARHVGAQLGKLMSLVIVP